MGKKLELNIDTTKAKQQIEELQKGVDKLRKEIPLQVTVKTGDAIIFTHPSVLGE